MEFRSFLVLILSQALLSKVGSTLKAASDEDATNWEMTQLEERLTDLIQKLSSAFEEAEKTHLEDKSNLLARMDELETRCLHSSTLILGKLKNAEKAFIKVDAHLLNQQQEAQKNSSDVLQKVKRLEERCTICNDVDELNKILRNHTSQITALNTQLLEVQNTCSEPPPIGNGYPLTSLRKYRDGAVVTYACRGNRTLVGSGEMACRSGEWTGDLECMNSCNTEDLKDYDGLDIPMNSIIQHSKSLVIRCRGGYFIASTSESLTCFNGTWRISDNPCMKESCDGEPPAILNGKTIDFERKNGSKVQYECDERYALTSPSAVHCNRGNWEGQAPVCSFFDATFSLYTYMYPEWIHCYSDDKHTEIDFSRVLDTGSGAHLPGNVNKGSGYARLNFWNPLSPQRFGFFQCGFSNERGSMKINVQTQNLRGDLYFVDHSKVANVGDAVELEVKFDKVRSIRWRHNGVEVPSWQDKDRVEIPSVQTTDGGTYECYYEGQRGVTAPALLRLIVRKCKKNLFGEHCDQECPPCYNGGICHDHLGLCVCPSGFNGHNCEITCGEGLYGANCSRVCYKKCKDAMFCHPDPKGCSCPRGWKGIKCNEPCEPGWYGVDCKQPCHCASGSRNCDRFTGVCSGGCSPGWTGQSCQIQVVD